MKQIDHGEVIKRIHNMRDKHRGEVSLRRLWRECFGDPPAYEDFYFSYVYPNNIVYTIQDKGMLHLNPYSCMVQGREQKLHYIVGVATEKEERRKGIMRRMLCRALTDMYKDKEPFTYLMPADVRYYQPFQFVSISTKRETILAGIKTHNMELPGTASQNILKIPYEKANIQFVKYEEIPQLFGLEGQQKLFQHIDRMLSYRYDVFVKHDKGYFDLLLKEKKCQDGDVVFCFNGERQLENFEGFFAYGMEDGRLIAEQYLFEQDWIESCLAQYYKGSKSIIHQFPFMVRIVHAEVFLTLFAELFYEFAIEGKRLLIEDPIITGNNGIYTFSTIENRISVKKQEKNSGDKRMWDVKMTVEELAGFIFGTPQTDKVFFAEVI